MDEKDYGKLIAGLSIGAFSGGFGIGYLIVKNLKLRKRVKELESCNRVLSIVSNVAIDKYEEAIKNNN